MNNGEENRDAALQEKIEIPSMEGGDLLYCVNCGKAITRERFGFAKDGSFVHTFTNPSGYVYKVGCFSNAPGTWIVGEYTGQFSWFKGYLWCYLLCEGCNSHMGWHFSSPESAGFHGIILERIGL